MFVRQSVPLIPCWSAQRVTGRDSTDGNQNISSEQAKEPSLDELTALSNRTDSRCYSLAVHEPGAGREPSRHLAHARSRTQKPCLRKDPRRLTVLPAGRRPRQVRYHCRRPRPRHLPLAPPEAPPAAPSPAAVPPLPVAAPPVPAAAPPVPAVVEPSHIETGSQSAESSEPRRSAGSLRTRRAKHKAAESQSVDPAQPTAATRSGPTSNGPTNSAATGCTQGRPAKPWANPALTDAPTSSVGPLADRGDDGVAYLAGSLSLLHRVRSEWRIRPARATNQLISS